MSLTAPFLISAGIIALVSIPLIFGAVPPNRFYGFRTRRTLSNERIWYRVNRFAGWAMFFAAAISAAVLSEMPQDELLAPGYAAGILVVPLLVALGASYLYLRGMSDDEN